jgi:fanconi anemia group I protein
MTSLLTSMPLYLGVILTGFLRFFGGRRGGCVRAPRYITWQVESTARMNVSFAVKQDPTLVPRFNEGAVSLLWDAVVVSR